MAYCYLCKSPTCKIRSTHVLFQMVNGCLEATKPKWNGKSATVCKTCAFKKMISEEQFHCGYLSECLAKQYCEISGSNGKAERLCHEGLVVLKLSELNCSSGRLPPFVLDIDNLIEQKMTID